MSYAKRIPLVVTALICLLLPLPITVHAGSPRQADRWGLSDPEELEAFLDGLVTAQLIAYHVPGATIAIVKDGELFFAKGYGYADLERRIPVQADQTLFRPGSISKLFTWTAVMQLYEQGRLDLDADINTYLDFQIPATHPQPITLRHLMTHTPGFEDIGLGLFSRSADSLIPLGERLSGSIPRRVFPPGEVSAYSNYGAGLAGYIVERVSGMPFEEYVETNIYDPLGMAHTTFRQPLPPELAENMAKGYIYSGGRYEEGTFEFVQPAPVGALSATATDLAIFMIAHLQNGQYGNAQILKEETARHMHTLQFSHDERLPGWGDGFVVAEQSGQPAIGHGGDTIYFHSDMVLLPEENLGIFISTNSDQGVWMRFNFIQRFIEHYYPVPAVEQPQPAANFEQRAARYTGTYYPARMNFSTVEKTLLLIQPVNVQLAPDNQLQVSGFLGPEPTFWVEGESGVFTSVGQNLPPETYLVFKEDDALGEEKTQYAFIGDSAYIRQPWYGTSSFQLGLLVLTLFTFLTAVFAFPARGLVVRYYRRSYPETVPSTPIGARIALGTGWVFAILCLVFWLVFFVMMSDLNNVIFGLPPIMEVLIAVPWVLGILLIGMLVFTVLAWVRRYWTITGRLFYTVLTLAGIAHVWFLSYWNLL